MDSAELLRIFIAQVKARAKVKGYSINRLADFSGLGRGFMSEVLRGKKKPSLSTIASIAAALDAEPCELLSPLDDARKISGRRK